jgi:hypothetical protein
MCNVWGTAEVHTGFWWWDLRKRHHLEDLGIGGGIILKCIFNKWNGGAWSGLIWLKIGTGGRLL